MIDEICRDLGAVFDELHDVVTEKRELDEARAAADQVRNMAARGWPRHGVELAGQHQRWHACACGNERRGAHHPPPGAKTVQLPSVPPLPPPPEGLAVRPASPATDPRNL